jgi:hypothetical protein
LEALPVSPILVRPVREQLEHDRLIRLLQAKFKRKYDAGINPGAEQNAPVGIPPAAVFPDFALHLIEFELNKYERIAERSRDALFNDTMPSGASGPELMKIGTPTLILPGNDSSHAYSASVALKELMPDATLWDLLPERQNGRNTLEEILRFTAYLERRASARS